MSGWIVCSWIARRHLTLSRSGSRQRKVDFQTSVRRKLLWLTVYYLRGDWLKDKCQRCLYNWEGVTIGVLQGSVLGTLLFLILLNDSAKHNLNLFSDYFKIMRDVRYVQECNELRRALNKLQIWSDAWLMKFNSIRYNVTEMEESERRNVHITCLTGDKLQECVCERKLGPVFIYSTTVSLSSDQTLDELAKRRPLY